MAHKAFEVPEDDIYVPLHVGRALGTDLGFLGDDSGDNISDLNPYFGELTGMYWIWKNDSDSDYIGINHYRRFYVHEDMTLFNEADFKDILSNNDVMTSDVISNNKTNYDSYKEAHNISDLMAVKESCIKLYPEYEKAFDEFLNDNNFCYGNICVMPRETYMDYCTWMFSILFDASEKIDVLEYDLYQKRVYGFLSERLLNVYVRHNKLKVSPSLVSARDEKAETKELRYAMRTLIKNHEIDKARQMFLEIIKIRPDITLPMSDVLRQIPIIDHITYILHLENNNKIEGLLSYSDELNDLVTYYKRVYDILLSKPTEENIEFLKKTYFTYIMAAVMVSADLHVPLRKDPIDKDNAREIFKKAFSLSDFEKYQSLMRMA